MNNKEIIALLLSAKQKGVSVFLENGKLKYALVKGMHADAQFINLLKINKDSIVDFLNSESGNFNESNFEDSSITAFERNKISEIPLSFSQERLWFIDKLEGSLQYHIPAVLKLKGNLNTEVLSNAIKTIIQRHEVLRTVVLETKGKPFQRVINFEDWKLEIVESDLNPQAESDFIFQLIHRPFNLAKDFMLRANLLKISDELHKLVVTVHHIASDGWSTSIMVKELAELYDAAIQNRKPNLSILPIQYADFAVWQRNYMQGDVLESKLNYWKENLDGVSPLNLPTDFIRPAKQSNRGATQEFLISEPVSASLKQLSQENNSTLFMTLLAAIKVLLYRYSGQSDICIGTPIAGRQHKETEELIGYFINTLAIRSKLESELTFVQFLKQVRETTLDAFKNQELPFEKVVEAVVKQRDLSRSPIFQVMFVYMNVPEVPALKLGNLELIGQPIVNDSSKFDINFTITENNNTFQVDIEYCTDLFSHETIFRLNKHFEILLEAIISNPNGKISDLELLSLSEKDQILSENNLNRKDYSGTETLVSLVELQASKTPNATALVFGSQTLTYQALNEKSNQLAHYLMAKGVQSEELVPLCVARGFEMIIGILGILKSGGAYVPIDGSYPKQRIDFMLKDTKAKRVVSDQLSPSKSLEIINPIKDWSLIEKQAITNPSNKPKPGNLAYIIYTSGSTGQPKGVMIEHQGVVNLIRSQSEYFNIESNERILQFSNYSFDASVEQIFLALSNGASLVLFEEGLQLKSLEFETYLEEQKITHFHATPGFIENLSLQNHKHLKRIIAGGDWCKAELANRYKHQVDFYNEYGPTETTVTAIEYKSDKLDNRTILPIGKALANTSIYILDESEKLQPIGVVGEIYIGGVQVARGYLNNEELTAQKFILNPFNPNERLYKTGDLGKWLPDGNIEFLGRKDDQVKIRGYRIELAEIESAIEQIIGIRQSAVLAKDEQNRGKGLVAYIVNDRPFHKEKTIQKLKLSLPEYMIPQIWVEMEAFPLTKNGKLDKKALPEVDLQGQLTKEYLAPRNKQEQEMALIWENLIGVKRVGVFDNFFELGGHSLLAMRVISELRQQLEIELNVKDLFNYPTIAQLCDFLKNEKQSKQVLPAIEKVVRPKLIPLSFSQERLWFIHKFEGSVQYHVPAVLALNGPLNVEALSKAISIIVQRHEVLRTVIKEIDGKAYQQINSFKQWKLDLINSSKIKQDKKQFIQELLNRPFDLSEDFMLRAHLIKQTSTDHVLVVILHHIASDGWSISLMVKELVESYKSIVENTVPKLPILQIQYADFSIWQRNLIQGELLEQKLTYWKKKLAGVAQLELPSDFTRPAIQSLHGASLDFELDAPLTKKIQELSFRSNTSLYMTLLASFKVLLFKYTAQEDICVGTPIAGRQQKETENLIGFFINTLALRSTVNAEITFNEFLNNVKSTTLEAYENQEIPFEKIVESVVKERDLSRNPLFQVMFIFQNAPEVPELKLGNLSIKDETVSADTVKFDLQMSMFLGSEGLVGTVEYSTDLYKQQTIKNLLIHFKEVLISITNNSSKPIGEMNMISGFEQNLVTKVYNQTKVEFPELSIVDLFQLQVSKTPEAIALVFGEAQLTYQELDAKSSQFAGFLIQKGIGSESLVPICIERGFNMIIGVLSILKSGGAYVPIDPDYPQQRIDYILKDINAKLVLSSKQSANKISYQYIEIVDLDNLPNLISEDFQISSLKKPSKDSLTYVLYTSGSTGQPKGVRMPSKALVNLLQWQQTQFLIPQRKVLQFTSLNFDVSFQEIFSTICYGSTLYLISAERRIDTIEMLDDIVKYQITNLFVPYVVLKNISENALDRPLPLQEIIVAGEQLKITEDVKHFIHSRNIQLVNHYGPTEAHVVTSYTVGSSNELLFLPPIGKPIANTKIFILDANLNPLPPGIYGEIHIGGVQLARGYLNNESLTQEKFIPNPFDKTERLYRTGDIGRWLKDGNIEYLGRVDDQVKIRGFRIEPGEIESAIAESKLVSQSVVIAQADQTGSNRLIAYVVVGKTYQKQELLAYLRSKLPDYMIPSVIMELESIPLTANGKVDKRALPQVDQSSDKQYIAPRNITEKALAEIWQQLLEIENVGIDANFFELGGHSLLAMRVISQVGKTLDIELKVKDLFQNPSIRQLAFYVSKQSQGLLLPAIDKQIRPEQIPLSFSQERLWFIDQLEGSVQYHIPAVLHLKGKLNRKALNQSFQQIVSRHEVLRTVIRQAQGQPYQQINPVAETIVQTIDAKALTPQERQTLIKSLINKPFDLSQDLMLRADLLELGEEDHLLVVTMHHIASDGWSGPLIVKELTAFYQAYNQDQIPQSGPLAIQYADYAIWQRQNIQGQLLENKLEYWKQKLQQAEPIELPLDYPRPAVQSIQGAVKTFTLDASLAKAIKQLSQNSNTSMFMTLLSAFKVLLHRYSNQQDITVGTPIAGRQQMETEPLIGFFVNTLALRSELKADQSFQDLLDQVRTTTLEAYEHQEIPFEKVVETVVKQRDLSRSPLFQVMFVYQNTPEMPKLELGELDLSMDTSIAASSKFEISLTMHESNEGLEGSLEYCTDLYSESTIERMQSHFVALLKSITTDPKTQIGELEMLSSEEQMQLLETFNQTKKSYPQDQTIVELFEQQVKRTPQATAIIFEDQTLSYQELNEKSNQLAHYLKAKGVKPETLVPICLERSVEMMIGILGILKSGGAYVPIDPQYPQDRMAYMLNDCNSAFLLTTEKHTIKTQNVIQQINLKTAWKQIESYPNTNLKSEAKLKNLAYVIYTSGSTGKPKGVMNQHSGLLNRLLWAQDYYKLSVEDKVLQKTTFCFDVSVWELLWPLISGSQLIFAKPEGHKDQQYLKQIIEEQKITMLHFVPSMLEIFLTDINPSECPSLKKVLTSGEALKPSQVKLFKEKLPGTELHNLYGPTEAAIDVTYWSLPEKKKKIKLVPIGKPVSNTQILILNSANKLVPVGCEGEIHIGGVQVARGYLNNETLTKEKFIINPFDKSRRLYKTGDKGRWLSDGNIEYLGRLDDQLKIRGFRIEPGEIESAIAGSKLTKQSVVIAKADQSGSKRLIAYVVGNKMYQKQELLNYLRSKLPDYMIPSVIMELTSIPLTANGKVDKRALPEVEQSSDKQFIAPRNKTEKTLAEIWQQLLEIEQVGIDDNFFELGGHSLLAMRVISQVRSELQVELTVRELFQNPNIRNLAEILAKQNGVLLLPSIDIQVRPSHIPLSFSQERLWFIDQLEGTLQYHIPAVLTLKGHLNLEALHFSFEQIVLRHEVLRTVFRQDDGKPYQKINDSVSSIIQVKDITSIDSETEISNLIEDIISKPFDLSKDLMLRVVLLKRSSMHHILIVCMHHIASDGWSESIIVKELTELYTAFSAGKPTQLQPLAIQYADFAIWQRNYIQGELLETKLNYWKKKLQTPVPIDLPLDYSRPPVQSVRGAVSSFKVDSDLSNRLKQLSHEKNTTLFMTLLAVYKVLLYRYSNQETITVGTPIAGRQQLETEKLIGFFVNTLALRSSVKSDQSFEDLLSNVRNTTLEAYENQEIPFEKIVEAISKGRDLSRSPIFQVMFVFHNNPDVQASALGDLELSQDMELKPSAKFELTLAMSESSQGIQGTIEYCTDLFKEETILRMQQHFVNLLVALTQNPSQNIGSLEMLSAQEESMIVKDFNAFKKPYPSSKTLVELFLEQVSNSPNSIAIEFEGQSLTYQELNERSNQLAHYLRKKGVKKNQIVPVCLKRGPQLLVAILAVLKTESAYAPIDMDYPSERISFMLNDCNASVVIKEKDQQLPMMENCLIINIDQEQKQIDLESKKDLKLNSTPDSIAYIIYTSGSSGTPKGVMVKHQNIVSLVKNTNYVNPGNKDILLTTGSPSFDATTFEYWAMLLNGGKLVLCTEHTLLDSVLLQKEIESRKVSIMWFTSSWFNQLVDLQPNLFKSLKTILVGGEKLSEAHINKLLQHFPKIKIINGYGPTENTTFSLTYPINNVILNGSVPIGKPLNNRTAYVLNSNLKTQPIGVPGEIYLGGAGLSAGYLNNQFLTDEKFVANPFELNERIYKTGDLGRWLPDGNMEYLGRLDEQVKIRGYRIELGEIESAIQNIKSIVRSTVALKQDSLGNKKLVAYVISESKFDKEQAISQLQLVLPEYMVPQFWFELQDFPLTPNGKIDKKALPDPDISAQLSEKYLAPQTKTELDLAEIWQELLDIETIGILDDFFELGGHSLLVIRLLSLIRRDMDVELGVKDIFENPTIQQLAAYVESSNKGLKMPAITPQKRTEFIPLSFSQERLYFIDQLNGSVQYHISSVLRFNGQLNIDALNASFNQVIQRHEVLRTVIKQHNGLVFQEVNSLNEWQINQKDVSKLSAKELDKLISKLVNKPFNLAKDLMLRVHLLRTSQDSYLLVLTLHHIASDGWSASIFVKELIEFYVSSVQNKAPNLKPLAIQYADYAIWQRNYLQGNLLEQKLEYWKTKLQNNTPLQLPVDFPRPALQSTRGALFEYKIDHELKDKLKLICQNNNSTMFMTLLAAFKILLFRYSNQQDITVGTPIAGREQMEIEPLIGFFVNTLAIRSEIKPGKSFVQILAQVRNNLLEAYEHQEISFEKVVEAVVKQRDLSRSPLFQVMFIYHNNPEIPALELANLQLTTEPSENSSSKFEITINASETKDGLMFSTEYCTDLFTEATIKRLHLHFEELLLSIVASPAQRIEILNILPNQEKALIQENFSTNSQTFPVDKTVIGLFEQQVEKTPKATALIFEGQALSYHQLNEKANQVAHYLIQLGVNNQSLVPICIERSFEMSIGILAILKTGAAYVPVDPQYPLDRIQYIIDDCNADILLTGNSNQLAVNPSVVTVNLSDWKQFQNQSKSNLETSIELNNLAYVIYTSGSTGKPKGVMNEHGGLLNRLLWAQSYYKLTEKDSVLQKTTFCFDVSVWELIWPLLVGAKLVFAKPEGHKDSNYLKKIIEDQSITMLHFVPSMLEVFLSDLKAGDCLNLKKVLTSGEALKTHQVQLFESKLPKAQLHNLYGPTEAAIDVTYWSLPKEHKIQNTVPIGKPVANTSIYILDPWQQVVPLGCEGEIHIAGVQVARGYLNNDRLTRQKFVKDPFQTNTRMYKTGDKGRWLTDGNIEYLGRTDEQLKVRGFRIEPGEIEIVIIESGLVKRTAVIGKQDSMANIQLVAYVVVAETYQKESLLTFLKQKLPDYMIPAVFMEIDEIPLTSNGKLNRKALPEPSIQLTNEIVPPRNELEKTLVEVWKQVLNLETISIYDNFFEIGGHSLLAFRILSGVRKSTGFELELTDLVASPTIAQLAEILQKNNNPND